MRFFPLPLVPFVGALLWLCPLRAMCHSPGDCWHGGTIEHNAGDLHTARAALSEASDIVEASGATPDSELEAGKSNKSPADNQVIEITRFMVEG